MPHFPTENDDKPVPQRPANSDQLAGRDKEGKYQLLPEYSLQTWSPPEAVKEAIERRFPKQ